MVSVCLPSDALLQHLPSYLVFSYPGMGYLFMAAPAKHSHFSFQRRGVSPYHTVVDLQCGITPLGPPAEGTLYEKSVAGGMVGSPKDRGSGREELPQVQGKEQRLRFAGAAVKRYPTPKVRENQVRW